VQFKAGVLNNGVKPEILTAMLVANAIMARANQPFVVTSCTEAVHSPGSKHYVGYAFDFRLSSLGDAANKDILAKMKASLTEEYDVILEENHFHVEFDPKKAMNLTK
jgi:hypothetical protein